MKKLFVLLVIVIGIVTQIAAQQNWAAIPCSRIKNGDAIQTMFVDSLHNEMILYSNYGYSICNTTYKGMFAYNGIGFHDLDFGLNKHTLTPNANGAIVRDCITFGNRTLFGGGFTSIGSDTLYTKSIALWNGTAWDTFPTRVFDNAQHSIIDKGLYGFLKYNGQLWMYGGFDTIGNTITTNLAAYDGYTFTAVPTIPVSGNSPITKMIAYKNKLIATGNFDNYPSSTMWRLAQYDGTNWAPVGTGVLGGIGGVWDMAIYKDTLYIGGSFSKSAGNAGNYLMKWDGTHLTDAGFGGYCGFGHISKLLPYNNRLYALGGFGCAANQKAFGVAYYENGTWTVAEDSIEGWGIYDAVVYNHAIYIGGDFKSINGDTTIQKFAKLVCPDFDAASGCLSGIKETSKQPDIKIFPNPSADKMHIEFEQSTAMDKISILNTLGQEVYNVLKPQSKQEIDISNLSPGIYFLKAENLQGQAVFKILKE